MPNLPTTRIGHTTLEVPILGLGTAPIGNLYSDIPVTQAIQTIHYALEHGITLFDTAPRYGAGLSEQRLGLALQGISRTTFTISSKVGALIEPNGTPTIDFSRDGILRSIEASLNRLQLDHLDIVHLHDPDHHYASALNEGFPTLAELRDQGVIRAIGAGMNQWQMLERFAQEADFDCFLLAGRYTLLEHESLETFLPLCTSKGISILLGGIYNSGILATGPIPGAKYNYTDAPSHILDRVHQLQTLCQQLNTPLQYAALQFPLAHPAVSTLVVGAQSPTELSQSLQALHHPIPPQLWSSLKTHNLLPPTTPTP